MSRQLQTISGKVALCNKCKSDNLFFYDGLLGYEAVKCKKCGFEHSQEFPVLDKED
jgi:predicted Zn-ribbon and HTH transcriptional regulator